MTTRSAASVGAVLLAVLALALACTAQTASPAVPATSAVSAAPAGLSGLAALFAGPAADGSSVPDPTTVPLDGLPGPTGLSGVFPVAPALRVLARTPLEASPAQPYPGLTRSTAEDAGRGLTVLSPTSGPATAILLVLPGFRLGNAWAEDHVDVAAAAAAGRWAVLYPSGLGGSWDAGRCCGTSAADHVDDLGYLEGLVGRAETAFAPAGGRLPVVGAGFSNGAMMVAALTCRAPGLLAGAVEVAGNLEDPGCAGARALRVVSVRSASDATVPVAGGLSPTTGSVDLPDSFGYSALTRGRACQVSDAGSAGIAVTTTTCAPARPPGPAETVVSLSQEAGQHEWSSAAALGLADDTAVTVDVVRATVAGSTGVDVSDALPGPVLAFG